MGFSALPYSDEQLALATHNYEFNATGKTYLCLDKMQSGVGNASCGHVFPMQAATVLSKPQTFSLLLKPITHDQDPADIGTQAYPPNIEYNNNPEGN